MHCVLHPSIGICARCVREEDCGLRCRLCERYCHVSNLLQHPAVAERLLRSSGGAKRTHTNHLSLHIVCFSPEINTPAIKLTLEICPWRDKGGASRDLIKSSKLVGPDRALWVYKIHLERDSLIN
jgi:hypothetical protein